MGLKDRLSNLKVQFTGRRESDFQDIQEEVRTSQEGMGSREGDKKSPTATLEKDREKIAETIQAVEDDSEIITIQDFNTEEAEIDLEQLETENLAGLEILEETGGAVKLGQAKAAEELADEELDTNDAEYDDKFKSQESSKPEKASALDDKMDSADLTDSALTDETEEDVEEDGENQTLGVSKELYNKGQYHKESLLSHYVSRSKLMGKRVTLRCIEKTDISHIWRWAGKNPVINKLGLPIPIAKEEIIEWVNSQVNEDPNDRALYTIEQEDNIPIGLCGLFKIENSSRRAEYFILIGDPDFLGHDYGAEATHLMLDLAFNLLNLNRLESFILDEDERAMHSFSKNSFKKEGLLYEYTYLNGEYKNVLVLSILKSEYEEFMR